MSKRSITFDEVFAGWLAAEAKQIEGRNILAVAQNKGFNSIAEWRLASALRMGLDKKQWHLEEVDNPNEVLPQIIIGPYQGWSIFFENQLNTTFAEALKIHEFKTWCTTHDRILPISQHLPLPTTLVALRKPDGRLLHIEGGHQMCAVAYAQAIGQPIDFTGKPPVTLAVADFTESDQDRLMQFLKQGTFKTAQ